MEYAGILIGLVVLGIAAFVLLGWTLPLIAGLIRRKHGKSSIALIVFGGVWCALSILVAGLIGLSIFSYIRLEQSWEVAEFDPSAYKGASSAIVVPYKGESCLTFSTDKNVNYRLKAADGRFVVPAGSITPTSYSIRLADDRGKYWTASWRFDSRYDKPLDCTPDVDANLDWAPPLIIKATRKSLSDGAQKIGIEVVDRAGNEVTLYSDKMPVLQIVDESGKAVWTHTMEYG